MVNLKLHGFSILLIRNVTPTSRLAPISMGSMHTNLPVPPSLKIEKVIFTLGPHQFLPISPWTYYK